MCYNILSDFPVPVAMAIIVAAKIVVRLRYVHLTVTMVTSRTRVIISFDTARNTNQSSHIGFGL